MTQLINYKYLHTTPNRTRQPKHTPGGQACENAHIQDLRTTKSHFVLGVRPIYVPL